MNENKIQFFTEDITYHLKGKGILRRGIVQLLKEKGYTLGPVNIIFCSDRFLKRYNKSYLKHNYYTDVIAFNLADNETVIAGDIYISLDRIRINAKTYRVPVKEEIARVVIHGILHLTGMDDSTGELRSGMRNEENRFISSIFNN